MGSDLRPEVVHVAKREAGTATANVASPPIPEAKPVPKVNYVVSSQ